jgi:2,5-diketo-D-gluconate reductase A
LEEAKMTEAARANEAGWAVAPVPSIELNDGKFIPQVGFGVWQVPNEEVVAAVVEAIDGGYRSVDTAQGYDNERGVGEAIRKSGIDRKELFVTSKLRTKLLGFEEAQQGVEQSLETMGLSYLDMFLIHWPAPALGKYVDAWRGLIEAQKKGYVRSIGVSNFQPEHLEAIISGTGIIPAVNQIETHPHFQQRAIRETLTYYGIKMEAYSPLGTGSVLDDPVIEKIAERHGKSPAQIILRWHLREGRIVIPKSVTPERIRSNLDLFTFDLTDEDMEAIAGVDDPDGGRTGSDPDTFNDLY